MVEADQIAGARAALGRQLAASRRAAGLSQEQLAPLIDYSRSTVANVETGRQHVPRVFWRGCDQALRTGDALCRSYDEAEAAVRSVRARDAATARYESLTATLGQALTAASAGAGPAGDLWRGAGCDGRDGGLVAAGNGLAASDPEVVVYLSDALPQHARIASTFGGSELVPLVLKHVGFLLAGYDQARGRHRENLVRLCARYAEFAGWLCQDLGRPADARFWSDRAMRWARQAGDAQFASYVLMRKSDLAEEQGPAGRVLGLAQAAGRVHGLTWRGRALVLQQEAVGHAQNGDALMFERTLERARECVAAAAGTDDAPWGLYCTPGYVGMQEASGWMDLGQPGTAVTVFERELAGLPPLDQVDGGVFRARLARAYAGDGRGDQAALAALGAWDMARATGSRRALRELARVRRAVGQPETEAMARFVAVFDAHAAQAGRSAGDRVAW